MAGAGVRVGAEPGVEAGAGVLPETSLDASSKRDAAPAPTVTEKAAGTGEAEAARDPTGPTKVALRATARVAAEAGVAAGARRGARRGPSGRGAKSAENVMKVTRRGGS